MNDSRENHTAALLTNGKVLIAGGQDAGGAVVATAEAADPATGAFTPTTGNMTDSREFHTATTLDNGQVLITGGQDSIDPTLATANTDPAGNFTLTTSAFPGTGTNMTDSRERHTATLFTGGTLNGMVLIAGGIDDASVVQASTELYNPANGSFTAAGDMTAARENQTATLLADESVLVAGGFGVSDGLFSAELFDPATQKFDLRLSDERQSAAATLSSRLAKCWSREAPT